VRQDINRKQKHYFHERRPAGSLFGNEEKTDNQVKLNTGDDDDDDNESSSKMNDNDNNDQHDEHDDNDDES